MVSGPWSRGLSGLLSETTEPYYYPSRFGKRAIRFKESTRDPLSPVRLEKKTNCHGNKKMFARIGFPNRVLSKLQWRGLPPAKAER